MKNKILIIAAIFCIALTSCKKDSEAKQETTEEVSKPEAKQNFSVELDVSSEKDDDFALYFTEDNTIAFNSDHTVWRGVKGGNAGFQKVVFDLSEEIIPTHIRLDLGLKKGAEQGDITLKNVKVSYYGKSFEFPGTDFLKYFITNKDVKTEFTPEGGIKFLKNTTGTTTAFYYPEQKLVDEIAKITK